jgi:signal transduction histidine kinase
MRGAIADEDMSESEARWSALGVAVPVAPLSADATCAEVYDLMTNDESVVALAVMEDGVPVGLADRISLMSNFARQYWREIYAHRPITKLMDAEPLAVDAMLPVEAIGTLIATRKPSAPNAGFIVLRDGRYFGIGSSVDLLKRIADHAHDHAKLLVAAQEKISSLNHHLEKRIEERTKELEEAQREIVRRERLSALGQLTATVAHELRNPLSAIRNTLFGVREITKTVPFDLERPLGRMERSITRCDRIIADLLDFTRARALQRLAVTADHWLGEVLDDQPCPEGVVLVRRFGAPNCHVTLDSDRMRRVVINLIENAVQAMADAPANGRDRRITVTTGETPSGYGFSVEDTGPGIPKDILSKVCEPLFSTKNFGTGLGLSTVKQIVEQHGGSLAIRSEPGQGTQVVVEVPAAEAREYPSVAENFAAA